MKNQSQKTFTQDYGLFVIRVRLDRGKMIQELMSDEAKQATGLSKLTEQELANLNAWLDPDKVLSYDPPPLAD